jgi:CheY-like chemotaxis protein
MQSKVIVVDDNEAICQMMAFFLEARSYQVHRCSNGQEAWQLFSGHVFPLVISDVDMPVMNGMVLLSKIKQNYRDTKVLMMSAEYTDTTPLQLWLSGALEFFPKPMDMFMFVEKVKELELDRRRVKRVTVTMPVTIDRNQLCESVNLSSDGILLQSPRPFSPEPTMTVSIKNQRSGPKVTIPGTMVRRCLRNGIYYGAVYFSRNIGQELARSGFVSLSSV